MKIWIKNNLGLILILTLALSLRIYHLTMRGEFWFDEWFSLHFATLPTWTESWKYWIMETNPPLYTIFLRFYTYLAPTTNTVLRLPSLIFGLTGIAILYKLAEKLFNRRTANWTALFAACSGLFIHISTENRVYSLMFLLSVISLWLFYFLATTANAPKKYYIEYFLINTLLLYSHITALAFVGIQFLGLIIFETTKPQARKIILANLASGLIFCFWFLPWIFNKLFGYKFANYWYFTTSGGFLKSFLLSFGAGFVDAMPGYTKIIYGALVFLFFFAFYKTFKKIPLTEKKLLIYLLTLSVLPILAATILGVFVPKYYICFYPALFLIAGKIFSDYFKTARANILVLIIYGILIYPSLSSVLGYPYVNYNYLAKSIKSQAQANAKLVVDFTEPPLLKRAGGFEDIQIVPVYMATDTESFEYRTVNYNSVKKDVTEDELKNWIKENLGDSRQIFILQHLKNLDLLTKTMEKNGYKKIMQKIMPSRWEYFLVEYQKI